MIDFNGMMPEKGRSREEILMSLEAFKQADASWENGKMFGFVYCPDEEAALLMREVSRFYFFENVLNSALFPSVARLEREVVSMATGLLHGGEEVAGSVTSGGTESITLAMKAARDLSFELKPSLQDPEVILPVTAHPAFHKAARYLGCKVVPMPVKEGFTADAETLPALVNERTILLVGSAPSYSHGVVDPIGQMAQFAADHGIYFHVDACLGGFFLPFMEMLGHEVPAFDFRIPGVTSISADLHKYGYGAKGASVVLYRGKRLWRAQFFVHCDWPGGLFGSPTFLGSHNGYAAAAAWAMLMHHGLDGYLDMTRNTLSAAEKLKQEISGTEGLYIPGNPVMSVFSFASDRGDIFRIGDELQLKGWTLDRLLQPEGLHILVSFQNLGHIDEFLSDLQSCVKAARKNKLRNFTFRIGMNLARNIIDYFPAEAVPALASRVARSARSGPGKSGKSSSSFYGIAASLDDKKPLNDLVTDYLDRMYSFRP